MGIAEVYEQDMAAVAAEAARLAQKRGGSGSPGGGGGSKGPKAEWYQWRDGDNLIRILWPWRPNGEILKTSYSHRNVPPERDRHKCPKMTEPENKFECELCNALEEVAAIRSEVDLFPFRAAPEYVAQITLPFEGDDKVFMCRIPNGVRNWIITQQSTPHIGNLSSPAKGYLINVVRTKSGPDRNDVKYSTSFLPNTKILTEGEIKVILEQMKDLDKYLSVRDEDRNKLATLAAKMKAAMLSEHYAGPWRKSRRKTEDGGSQKTESTPTTTQSAPAPAPATAPVQQQPPKTVAQAQTQALGKKDCFGKYRGDSACSACKDEFTCQSAK